MRLFSGEASLYQTSRRYRTASLHTAVLGRAFPAQDEFGSG